MTPQSFRKRAKVLGFGLSCLLSFRAASVNAAPAENALTKTANAAAKPAAAVVTKAEEVVLFTVHAGKHWVLGRSDSNGTCKGYLGPDGVSWLSFPDPEFKGDDLMAVTSADGDQLALISSRDGAPNLWLLTESTKKLEALTDDSAGIIEPEKVNGQSVAFSPNGKYLAFIQRNEATVIRLSDRIQRALTTDGGVRALAWSPDGEWLAVVQGQSIRKIALSGAPDILLASDQCDDPSLAFNGNDEIFFAGSGLRVVRGQKPAENVVSSRAHPNMIALVNGGKDVALLTNTVGRKEVFLATPGAKTTALTQVTQGGAEGVWASASGKQLYFLRNRQLWRCDTNGLRSKRLGSVPTGFVGLGSLAPLKGVCQ